MTERKKDAAGAYKLTRLGRKTACEGSALDFMRDTMRLPDGREEIWDFVHHKKGGGAAVVPLLPGGRILMIRQYRPAVGRETLEIPAGACDREDKNREMTASRELLEETGYRAGRIRHLVTIDTAVAYCDESTEIYLATDLKREREQALDEAEEIRVTAVEISAIFDLMSRGVIRDAKTVAGICAAAVYARDEFSLQ